MVHHLQQLWFRDFTVALWIREETFRCNWYWSGKIHLPDSTGAIKSMLQPKTICSLDFGWLPCFVSTTILKWVSQNMLHNLRLGSAGLGHKCLDFFKESALGD